MSYKTSLAEARRILAEISENSIPLAWRKDWAPEIQAITKELDHIHEKTASRTEDSIHCALHTGPVAFVQTVQPADAETLLSRLSPLSQYKAMQVSRCQVQFWPVSAPVSLYKVQRGYELVGKAYALRGIDARDLLAATAGFELREASVTKLVVGHTITVPGKLISRDATGSYGRMCHAFLKQKIGVVPDWLTEQVLY